MSAKTRERILDVAEQLFARDGISGTSMRSLTREARVNLAAVHYHFGSKEGLLDAVVERRALTFNAMRNRALEEVLAGPEPTVEAILRAYLVPALQSRTHFGESAAQLQRLLARIHAQPREVLEPLMKRHFAEVDRRFADALSRAIPLLPADELATRFQLAIGSTHHVFSGNFGLGSSAPSGASPEAIIESLITFSAAGLRAPLTRPTAQSSQAATAIGAGA